MSPTPAFGVDGGTTDRLGRRPRPEVGIGIEMARPQTIEEQELVGRLSRVFRDIGYEGASLAMLAAATGLKKASLYHRFPHGKQQMAEQVLAAALSWYATNILSPLAGQGSPAERIAMVVKNLDAFYASGRQACLLNMLASPHTDNGPFAAAIKRAFEALIKAFMALAREAGHAPAESRARAERAVMLLHGSLVMCRGLRSSKPFRVFLAALPGELLAEPRSSRNRKIAIGHA